ncbi:hypothetical protein Bca4012_069261 [Brassica carinata]
MSQVPWLVLALARDPQERSLEFHRRHSGKKLPWRHAADSSPETQWRRNSPDLQSRRDPSLYTLNNPLRPFSSSSMAVYSRASPDTLRRYRGGELDWRRTEGDEIEIRCTTGA